jgi:hypothetical protein
MIVELNLKVGHDHQFIIYYRSPSSERSSPIIVPLAMTNPYLLLIPELDIHVDVGYVSNAFHDYFKDLVDYNKFRSHYSLSGI